MINKLNELLLNLLVFHAYINEMHGSRRKIPSKNLVRLRCGEGFNSAVKRLSCLYNTSLYSMSTQYKLHFACKAQKRSSVSLIEEAPRHKTRSLVQNKD
jgi:hypothetical protein